MPRKAIATISNAMDVGDPSNFGRILHIFGQSFPLVSKKLGSYSISDAQTTETIARVYQKDGYLLDPHGAVGYNSLEKYLELHKGKKGIFLETAHPVKFPDSVEKAVGRKIPYPPGIEEIMHRPKKSILIEPLFDTLKNFLLHNPEADRV